MLDNGEDFPLFLPSFDSNGSAEIVISANMAKTQSSNIAGSALSAVRSALKTVAPTSGIVTTLTQDSSGKIADQIDASAGMAFSAASKNSIDWDVGLLDTHPIRVQIYGPRHEVNENTTNYELGDWIVGFKQPFASYFYKGANCDDAAGQFDLAWAEARKSAGILSITLVENVDQIGKVEDYLQQQDWWSDDRAELEKAATVQPAAADRFCRRITKAISNLGLNTVDSYIVANAVARSSLVSRRVGTVMEGEDGCDYDDR